MLHVEPAAIYGSVSFSGDVTLGSSAVGAAHADHQQASIIVVSRATGHPVGVTTREERERIRAYLRGLAEREGLEF